MQQVALHASPRSIEPRMLEVPSWKEVQSRQSSVGLLVDWDWPVVTVLGVLEADPVVARIVFF